MLRINKIIKDFDYKGEFLNNANLSDLFDGMKFDDFNEVVDYLEDNDSCCISDVITELSDSMIDIYYYDLRAWSVDNYEYIEDAISEGLTDTKNPDFHKMIQSGQFLAFSNEFYSMTNEFKKFIQDKYTF